MPGYDDTKDLIGLREQILDNVKVIFPYYYRGVLGSTADVSFTIIMSSSKAESGGEALYSCTAMVIWGPDNRIFLKGEKADTPQDALHELLYLSCDLVTAKLFPVPTKESEERAFVERFPPERQEAVKAYMAKLSAKLSEMNVEPIQAEYVLMENLAPPRQDAVKALTAPLIDEVNLRMERNVLHHSEGYSGDEWAERQAMAIECVLYLKYHGPETPQYRTQLHLIQKYLSQNKALVAGLLDGKVGLKDMTEMSERDMSLMEY